MSCYVFFILPNIDLHRPKIALHIKTSTTYNQGKKHLEMSPFYTCAQNNVIICYMLPEIQVGKIEFFVILGHFYPFTPLKTQKIKNLKK